MESFFNFETCQNRKMDGLMGHGRFLGDFSGILPFLTLGLYIHAGKGSSFGMGVYELLDRNENR
jgi:hypothetical protein